MTIVVNARGKKGDPPREVVSLHHSVYLSILEAALKAKYPSWYVGEAKEMCGLLYAVEDGPIGFLQCNNIAPEPGSSFVIDPAAHRAIIEHPTREAVGMVHSHPRGKPQPSEMDCETYLPEGWLYGVVGMGGPLDQTGGKLLLWRYEVGALNLCQVVLY